MKERKKERKKQIHDHDVDEHIYNGSSSRVQSLGISNSQRGDLGENVVKTTSLILVKFDKHKIHVKIPEAYASWKKPNISTPSGTFHIDIKSTRPTPRTARRLTNGSPC